MENSHKILLGGLGVLLAVNVYSVFHGNSSLDAIQNNITISQKNIDSALSNISFSKSRIDSIQANMQDFSNYVKRVKDSISQINISKNAADTKSIKILNDLKQTASAAKSELEKTDAPPPAITIKSL